jgi:hypothetical protein
MASSKFLMRPIRLRSPQFSLRSIRLRRRSLFAKYGFAKVFASLNMDSPKFSLGSIRFRRSFRLVQYSQLRSTRLRQTSRFAEYGFVGIFTALNTGSPKLTLSLIRFRRNSRFAQKSLSKILATLNTYIWSPQYYLAERGSQPRERLFAVARTSRTLRANQAVSQMSKRSCASPGHDCTTVTWLRSSCSKLASLSLQQLAFIATA